MDYYYINAVNKAEGPVSEEQLRALLGNGTINANTKVAPVGSQEWVSITTVLPSTLFSPGAPTAPPVFQPQPVYGTAPSSSQTDVLAIVSLVLSIMGLVSCCYGLPLVIGGIVCGHISLSKIDKSDTLQGRGLAIAGLVCGYIGLVIGLVFVALMIVGTFAEGMQHR